MKGSRNPAESVVALLAVLGLRIVEVLATGMLLTGGLRAPGLVNVSLRFMTCTFHAD